MHRAHLSWPFSLAHSPDDVVVFHAGRRRRFRRAVYQWSKAGVALQYREVACPASWHLYVHAKGTYVVDHVDRANPDPPCNRPVEHLVRDVPGGGVVAVLGVLALIGAAAGLSAILDAA